MPVVERFYPAERGYANGSGPDDERLARWQLYVEHLERVMMAPHIVDMHGTFRGGDHFLGIIVGDLVVGHISLDVQPIISPATKYSFGKEVPLAGANGETLQETYVKTFAVEAAFRRRGYGSALQLAALDLTREIGCYQMRSWSSVGKEANFAMKLKLGFAAHPATFELPATGDHVSGFYFLKKV